VCDRTSTITAMLALAVALTMSAGGAQASDDALYPNWKGQWTRVIIPGGGQGAFDPTKPWGPGQQAPLTQEYQKVLQASMVDQATPELSSAPG
jgi:uncharacterized protein (DUF2147 family)